MTKPTKKNDTSPTDLPAMFFAPMLAHVKFSVDVASWSRQNLIDFIMLNWDGAQGLGRLKNTFFEGHPDDVLMAFIYELFERKEVIHLNRSVISKP